MENQKTGPVQSQVVDNTGAKIAAGVLGALGGIGAAYGAYKGLSRGGINVGGKSSGGFTTYNARPDPYTNL